MAINKIIKPIALSTTIYWFEIALRNAPRPKEVVMSVIASESVMCPVRNAVIA